jgi:hypothetical protein
LTNNCKVGRKLAQNQCASLSGVYIEALPRSSTFYRVWVRAILKSFMPITDRSVMQGSRSGFQTVISVGRPSSPSIKLDGQSRVPRGTSSPDAFPFRDHFEDLLAEKPAMSGEPVALPNPEFRAPPSSMKYPSNSGRRTCFRGRRTVWSTPLYSSNGLEILPADTDIARRMKSWDVVAPAKRCPLR